MRLLQTDLNIAWFAGLFEGEGCLGYYPDKRNPRTGSVRLYIESTDKDIIDRIQSLFGGKVWDSNYPSKPKNYKPSWRWGLSSKNEVRHIINLLYPYLGERRRSKCIEVLERINEQ